jgi:uncharacterized protein YjbJ (UPF0337 family)
MTWDQVKGAWKELRGTVRERWGKLTDSDLDTIAGQRDQLLGAIQRQYGVTRAQVEEQVAAFEKLVAVKFASSAEKKSPRGARRKSSAETQAG